jgi:vacuolar-type H+-ATPase subunit F/Vma7
VDYFFIGEAELATAFRFIGIDGIAVSDARECRDAFRRATRGGLDASGTLLPDADLGSGVRVLILTEEAADSLGADLAEWQLTGRFPLVVEIPGLQGRLAGRKTLVDDIREAIGIRV